MFLVSVSTASGQAGAAPSAAGAGAAATSTTASPGSVSTGTFGQSPTNGNGTNGNGQNGNGQNGAGANSNGNNAAGRNTADSSRNRNDADSADRRTDSTAAGSNILSQFQQLVFSTTGRIVPIFGAGLFGNAPSTFAPISDVPVGPSYILGPGDELRLQLSGQVNQQLDVTVDNTGSIQLPDAGSVHVAGIAYGQLTEYLRQQIGRYYRNFQLTVNLGSLRTIQVFVLGEAVRPGSYTISSLSTLLNALFASGGVLPQGTLRDIQVKRGGRTLVHFDLYDVLLNGDKTHDINLATGDVIFIPPVGPQVAAIGSLTNSAIYELRTETNVCQLITLAGGETNVAAGTTARLERIYEHTMRSIEDVSLANCSTHVLRDGDILSITSVGDRFRDVVTLRGNVANPGRYVWHPGMHISDLIPNKESLITRNYWRERNQLGLIAGDYVAEGDQGPGALGARGAPRTTDIGSGARTATGTNSGGSSVAAALTASSGTFFPKTDVLLSAPDVNLSYAVIERLNPVDLTTSLVPFNLGKLILEGDATQNLELFAGDVITIFSKADIQVPTAQQTRFVRLEGEFVAPGVYSVLPGETLRGLLRRVGGFTPEAYLYASEFTRQSTRLVELQRLREYTDQLEAQVAATTSYNTARAIGPNDATAVVASAENARASIARLRTITPIGRIVLNLKPNSFGPNSVPDLALEDSDRFIVPRVPSNVNVEGQVYSSNAFVYTPGRHVIEYLREAGGPDRQADRKRAYVLRADGSVISSQYSHVDRAIIYPGDTIVVPPNIDSRGVLQRIIDVTTIIGQLGIGVAGIAILTR